MKCPHTSRPGASPDRCSQCQLDPAWVTRHAAPEDLTDIERAIRIRDERGDRQRRAEVAADRIDRRGGRP